MQNFLSVLGLLSRRKVSSDLQLSKDTFSVVSLVFPIYSSYDLSFHQLTFLRNKENSIAHTNVT